MIKNAIAYITRKRNRTLIIFIILTIVLSCLYSCLTIMKSSDEIEKALYESSNSSISITKKDGNYFNVNEFKDIEKLKEVEEIIMQYDGLAKLKDAKVVSGEQRINREDLSDEFKNVVSLEATNNTNTEDTAVYQDATFFVKGDKNLDSVIKEIEKLDINWREYNLIKSSSNYPALQQSISGIYSISNKLFAGSLIFAGVVVSLLLLLWMNARKKEIAVLLSLGISKLEIFGQLLIEIVLISIPAYVGSYFLARYTAEKLGNNILNKVTGDIAKQIARQSASSQLGGGAEAEGFNKTLSILDINVLPKFMSLVLLVSLIISSFNILRRNPKELLIDNK